MIELVVWEIHRSSERGRFGILRSEVSNFSMASAGRSRSRRISP